MSNNKNKKNNKTDIATTRQNPKLLSINTKASGSRVDSRIRRTREQKETPIQIASNEFELLAAYLNIISDNLATYLKKEFSYRIEGIVCPSIKPSKVSKNVIEGNSRLKNEILLILIYNDKEVRELFTRFVKENRYLNITLTDTTVKAENSDKYQYFNIEMSENNNVYTFTIYSRRRFTVNNIIKKRGLFSRF